MLAFSFHIGELWCERPGQDDCREQAGTVHIGPLVSTRDTFRETLFERGYGLDVHVALGDLTRPA